MQLSSTLKRLPRLAASVDVATLAGNDAVALLRLINPSLTALLALRDALAARAVEANQHNVAGSKSGASFIGTEAEISERSARVILSRQKALALLPDVSDKARSGELSLEKADVIAGAAGDDSALARELLNVASTSTVEDLRQRGADRNASNLSRHKQLRDSQFISITRDHDNLVLGQFKLLPEIAPWLNDWQHRERQFSTSADKAEAFSEMITKSGDSKLRSTVSFHVDVDSPELVTMGGVGVVPASALAPYFDEACLQLLIKANNKLIWYSESRNHKGPLAEFIKRAVKAFNYDKCAIDNCGDFARQVDHIQARINRGANPLDNLQGLCEAHHHAKTKQDAPWTAETIYAKARQRWQNSRRRQASDDEEAKDNISESDEMFPDTG